MATIAIIGGGFTGLVAARTLVKSGHDVTIYEAGEELGGLAASFCIQGEPIEKAYHHIFRTDRDIIQLIHELGLANRLEWLPSSVSIFRDGKMWSFMSPLDLLRFTPCSLVGRIRTGLVALYLQKTKQWRKLVNQRAYQWMNRYCGASATNAIWGPLLKGKFAHHAENISMAWLWARLHMRANSREPGEGEKLGYVKGGFVQVVNALESELLNAGVIIHRSCRVKSIHRHNNRPSLVIDQETKDYDAVLFTGSNRSLARLLPADDQKINQYKESLGKIDYLGAICYVFASSQNLGNHYWVNVNDESAPFLVFIQHTNLIPKERYNGKHVYYIGAYVNQSEGRFFMAESELIREWHQYVKFMHPDFDASRIEEQHVFRLSDAQHIVDLDYESKIMRHDSIIPNLYVFNFSQIFPEDRGTNFAVKEGLKAGLMILEGLQSS